MPDSSVLQDASALLSRCLRHREKHRLYSWSHLYMVHHFCYNQKNLVTVGDYHNYIRMFSEASVVITAHTHIELIL